MNMAALYYLNQQLHAQPHKAFVALLGKESTQADAAALSMATSEPPKLLETFPVRPTVTSSLPVGATNHWIKRPGDPNHFISNASQTPQERPKQAS